jgi:hypothetical protein
MKPIYLIILTIVLFLTPFFVRAQFFIDVYYGYNHSNEIYTFQDTLINTYHILYLGKPIDTIFYPNGNMTVNFEDQIYEHESYKTEHSFYSHEILGVDIGCEFNNFVKSSFAYNYINFLGSLDIRAEEVTADYIEDMLYYRRMKYHEINYKMHKLSIGFAAKYPYNKFEIELFLSGDGYYTKMEHGYFDKEYSDELISEKLYWYSIYEYSGVSYGFSTGIGLSYNFYKHFSVFGKFGYSKGEILLTQGKLIDSKSDNFKPEDIASNEIPFNNIPFNGYNYRLGIRYTFGNFGKAKDVNTEQ